MLLSYENNIEIISVLILSQANHFFMIFKSSDSPDFIHFDFAPLELSFIIQIERDQEVKCNLFLCFRVIILYHYTLQHIFYYLLSSRCVEYFGFKMNQDINIEFSIHFTILRLTYTL